MNDSPIQNDGGAGDATLSMELAERLLRRRTESLGVIDVQQPQQHYARTAGWVAQRFGLLEHWKTRYGSDEDGSAANANLVFAAPAQPVVEASTALSSPAQLLRAVQQSVPSRPSAAAAAPSSSPPQFRVRRRAAPATSAQTAAAQTLGSHAATPPDGRKATSNSAEVSEAMARSPAERAELRVAEIPAVTHHTAATPATLMLPKRLTASIVTEEETAGEAARDRKRSNLREGTSVPTGLADRTLAGNLVANTGRAYQRSEASSATTAPPVRVNRVEASPASLPRRLQRQSNSLVSQPPMPPSLPSADGPMSGRTNPLAEHSGLREGGDPLAIVPSPAHVPLVQRQAAGAAEIRTALSEAPRPVMVWRQDGAGASSNGGMADAATGNARSALPLAFSSVSRGERQVSRQTTTTESASSTNTESTQPAAAMPIPAMPPASQIDVAHLAEQVSRLLARQLTVERERRGRSGWR